MLTSYPFVLAILAAFAAMISAVFLRRAASVLGDRWVDLGFVIDLAAAAAIGWALAWAWAIEPGGLTPTLQTLAGWSLALAGGALTGWAVRRRGIRPLRRWSAERFEAHAPYRLIRRPIFLGLTAVASGLVLLRGTTAAGIWWIGAITAWALALELGDWELRNRLPASRDYLRRTPRVFPIRKSGSRA